MSSYILVRLENPHFICGIHFVVQNCLDNPVYFCVKILRVYQEIIVKGCTYFLASAQRRSKLSIDRREI